MALTVSWFCMLIIDVPVLSRLHIRLAGLLDIGTSTSSGSSGIEPKPNYMLRALISWQCTSASRSTV